MDLSTVRFGVGSHGVSTVPTGDRDLCIMEAVAYMAGESWSDRPACASPVVAALLRSWNDTLSDDDRDRLLPAAVWVPRLVGSRGDEVTEERRAYLALDWLVRVHTPAWLDLVPALAPHAAALRVLPEIVDMTTAGRAGDTVRAARAAAGAAASAAGAASWAASWAASGAAAGDASRAAAGAAAWAASGAASRAAAGAAAWAASRAAAGAAAWAASGAAAWAASGAASRAASGAAAWDAAGDALHPTVETLQQSAHGLLDRMLACGEHRREEE